jgi:predicted MFS family arabinose efflux permease
MADVTAFAGGDSYGLGYGLYNTAWALGILSGPALGGWLFERFGFGRLAAGWSLTVLVVTGLLTRVKSASPGLGG